MQRASAPVPSAAWLPQQCTYKKTTTLNSGMQESIWYFAEAFVQSASATQGDKYTCGADDLSAEESQIKGLGYSRGMFTAMPYKPKHLFCSVCFALERVWHFVVVRQAVTQAAALRGLTGRLSGSRPCGLIGKACWGLAAFCSSAWRPCSVYRGFSGSPARPPQCWGMELVQSDLFPAANPQPCSPETWALRARKVDTAAWPTRHNWSPSLLHHTEIFSFFFF